MVVDRVCGIDPIGEDECGLYVLADIAWKIRRGGCNVGMLVDFLAGHVMTRGRNP